MTKNKKNIGMIALCVVLALLIVFGVLYFAGVFDKKPVEVEPVEVVEKEPEAIGNITGIDHGEIEFDEKSGEATNLTELEAKNPPKAEEKEFNEKPEVTEPEPKVEETAKPEEKEETPISTGSVDAKEETPQPQQTSGGSSGTATLNGHSVRVVSSLSGLSPQKPFETVMCNGVPYSWDGSQWYNASAQYDDVTPPNDYSDIHLENGQWSGEHVGN